MDAADTNRLKKVTCPTCRREFPRSEFVTVTKSAPDNNAIDAIVVNPKEQTSAPSEIPQRQTAADLEFNEMSSSIVQKRRARQKAQPWIVVGSLLVLAAAVAGLTYFLVSTGALQAWPDEAAKEKAELERALLAGKEDATTDNTPPVVTKPIKKAEQKIKRIPKPSTRLVGEAKLKSTWLKTRPYIVKLTAQTPLGPKNVTGTVIDSRGWIATSYRAIQGATKISVLQSPKDILNDGTAGMLRDEVRGVIATDVAHDLAILSINRKFIISLTDLPILEQDNLVSSMYLIQCVAPTSEYPWATTESRIHQRWRLDDFPDDQKAAIEQDKISDVDTKWILHKRISPTSIGAPLLTRDGELAAINVLAPRLSRLAPDKVLAVPVKYIQALTAGANEKPSSLPLAVVSAGAVSGGSEGETASDLNDIPVVQAGSANRTTSIELNKSGVQCQAIDWNPVDDDAAGAIVSFAEDLLHAKELTEDPATDAIEKEVFDKQIAYWMERFESGILSTPRVGEDAITKFNDATSQQLGASAEGVFVAFVQVKLAAIESPRMSFFTNEKQDTVVFEIIGTEKNVITVLSNDWPPLRPSSQWLIIGRGTGQENRIQSGKTALRAEAARVEYIFKL